LHRSHPEPIPIEQLRALPEGTLHLVDRSDRRILVQKIGTEIQLLFDSSESCEIQSRLDLDRPLDLKSTYTRVAMLGLLWNRPPQRVHVLGLGGGRIPMVLRHHFPETGIDCTEITPAVTDLAIRYFGLAIDERLRVFHEDGVRFLERRRSGDPYDLIVVDAFSGLGFGEERFTASEFLQVCRRSLVHGGVLVLNILPGDPGLERKIAAVGASFRNVYLVREADAVVVFGRDGEAVTLEELVRRARSLQRQHRFKFPLGAGARSLQRLPPLPGDRQDPVPGS
jgi:spermidine synthase